MAKVQLQMYEFVVFTQHKYDKDGEVVEEGKVVVDPTRVLVPNGTQAEMLAARAIPDEYMNELERVQVVVRPF